MLPPLAQVNPISFFLAPFFPLSCSAPLFSPPKAPLHLLRDPCNFFNALSAPLKGFVAPGAPTLTPLFVGFIFDRPSLLMWLLRQSRVLVMVYSPSQPGQTGLTLLTILLRTC